MDQMRAVVFLDGNDLSGEYTRPLMLETAVFCPVLEWMGAKLRADGVRRFFVVCPSEFVARAERCFQPDDEAAVSSDPQALMDFLREDGPVAVFPCPMLPVDGGDSFAYTASAAALRKSWSGENGDTVEDARALPGWSAVYSHNFSELELRCRDEIVRRHLSAGVRILDPAAVYIDPRAEIGRGTLLLPGTILRGRTVIGAGCEIGPNAMIRDCTVGDDTVIDASELLESSVGNRTHVGPFAYVRPNSHIGSDIKVGDFVEVKNSTIGDGTKISHLTYVGDSDVGQKVNFGCGTVTTNYDGFQKYRCTIGDHAFLGCNTNLIAPVTVGEGAYTAAGSTITKDVPPDALAIARERQSNKGGWAARQRALRGKKEDK